MQPLPPIDVVLMAERLGVDAIVETATVEDGRLDHREDRTVITLRPGLSEGRRRFTIAHELAHLLLMDPTAESTAFRSIGHRGDAERACDDIAATILLPAAWLATKYRRRTKNLSTLRHLAHETQTSMSASLVRLNQVLGWHCSLLRWRLHADGWRLAGTAGVPHDRHRQIQTSTETGLTLSYLAGVTGRDQKVELPLLLDRNRVEVPVQISVRGSSAVALLSRSAL